MKRHFTLQPFFSSLFPVVAANTIVSMGISSPLFAFATQQGTLFSMTVNLISFVSNYFLLNLLAGIIVLLMSGLLHRKLLPVVGISVFFLLQTFLLADTKLYSIFHYHINSLVLNVLTTEGVTDSVILGKGTVLVFSFWMTIIFSAEVIINTYVAGFHKKIRPGSLSFFMKTARRIFAVCLLLIVLDKGLYAYGDLFNVTEITRNVKLYALYQPMTIKGFVTRVLHMQVNREAGFKYSPAGASLHYPKQQPVFDPGRDRKYNMIIIVLDGLRFDMLNDEVMPNLSAFAADNIVYSNNYSGGNGTRFGIFSLLYGIHGSYWHTFLAQRRSPVLLDTLLEKGYDFTVLSSTLLTFPEFRKTAFIKVPERIKDTFDGDTVPKRDGQLTRDFTDFLRDRRSPRPFFAFLYYNSSHEPFSYPDDFVRFQPVLKGEINYFRDMEKEKFPLLKNMYKNSVFYEDHLLGSIIRSLKEQHLLDNTIVVITGDHGEEFFENGFWGHTSSFDDYQLKTAFVMHYPGIGRRTVQRISSHHDLVPTLMESLGCVSPPEDYSQGFSLLSERQHSYITAANWDTAAMIDDELKVVYSTEMYNMGSFTVYKKADYSPVKDPGQLLKKRNGLLLDVLVRMSEFYKKM